MGLTGLLLLALVFLNLPYTQGLATRKVNQVLQRNSVPIHLDAIRKLLPGSLRIQGISLIGSGGDTLIYCGELHADIRLLGLIRNKVILKDVELDAARVELERLGDSEQINIAEAFAGNPDKRLPPAERSPASWLISIRDGSLSNVQFQMIDSPGGINMLQDVAQFAFGDLQISLRERQISFGSLQLAHADGELHLTPGLVPHGKREGDPWKVDFRKLILEDTDFSFSHAADSLALETHLGKADIRANGINMPDKEIHLNRIELDECMLAIEGVGTFHDLELKMADLSYGKGLAGVGIRKLAFGMDNGFLLDKLSGRLDSDEDHTDLELKIHTAQSRMELNAFIQEAFEDILAAPTELSQAELELSPSHISLDDIRGFIPGLMDEPYFQTLGASRILLDGKAELEDGSLNIKGLSVSQENNYMITLAGTIHKPFHLAEATGDMHLEASSIGQGFLEELASASGISGPLPELGGSGLEAHLSDSVHSPRIELSLVSPIGTAALDAILDFDRELFTMEYKISSLDMAGLLPASELGSFTGEGEFKGKGFSMDELHASYYLHVDTLDFKSYPYGSTQLTGTIAPGGYDLQLVAMDKALKADLQLKLDLGDSAHRAEASGIFQAQLDELLLHEETLNLQVGIQAQMTNSVKGLESELLCRDLRLSTPVKVVEINELKALFKTDSMQSLLHAEGDFFNARLLLWRPVDELDTLGSLYQHYFRSFRNASHMTASNRVSFLPAIDASVTIDDHELLDILLGDSILEFSRLEGAISKRANQNSLHASIKAEQLSYNSLEAGRLYAILSDSAGSIHMDLRADSTSLITGFDRQIEVKASSSNKELLAGIALHDYEDRTIYRLDLQGRADSSRIVITVPDKQIILNTEAWELDTPELLSIDLADNKILPSLSMRNDSATLRLNASYQDPRIHYVLDLSGVKLSTLIENELLKGIPEGTISGNVDFETDRNEDSRLDAALFVDHLRLSGEDFSDIRVNGELSRSADGAYALELLAQMDSLDLKLTGQGVEGGRHLMSGRLSHFPLALLEPFTDEHLSDMRGGISGNFHLASQPGENQLNGQLSFQNAQLKVNLLNTRFSIPEQSLSIVNERAEFKGFTVLDSMNRPLIVDGNINFSNPKSPRVDLTVTSREIQVMTRKERSNLPFTGNVFIDSRISIAGPLSRPRVGGNIRLSEGTEIFYQHREDMRMTETEKIVNFASYASMDEELELPALSGAGRPGSSSIGTVIQVDPNTRIHFSLEKRMFDIDLDVEGGGDIQYNLENDQMTLSGRYEIGEGNAFVKLVGWPDKSFRLAEGGYIRWDGMVENPELNLEAENRISTSYLNPIDGRNRDINFYVILSLKGYLSDLDVLFTIRTPDQYVMSVINTLSPEEQMRQAISVLLFETIDLPGISSSTRYMTQQVNQILSSQLNQLTRSAIKGVDISFGLDTYDESGRDGSSETTTSLSYEVSKTFLNNRAQIEFSGRLKDANQASTTSDHSLNNLSFEYTLDSAATKYLKIYNEHSYDDVFEGEVIQTGVGFKYSRRFKSLKDIWRRKQ